MGPCVGCGRPARASGLCSACRTSMEVAMRERDDARIDALIGADARDRMLDRRDEAS